MKYRIKKQLYPTNSTWPDDDYTQPEYVVTFEVQSKSFLFWHTVKEFKKIRQANELLNILKQEV